MVDNESIFDLADKFGVASPFGNWTKDDFPENSIDEVVIDDMYVMINELSVALMNTKKDDKNGAVIVPVIITVTTSGNAGALEISCTDGQSQTARRKPTTNIYEARFNVQVKRSYITADLSGSTSFIFKATLKNSSGIILDSRSIKTTLDTNRKIKDMDVLVPDETNEFDESGECGYIISNEYLQGDNVVTSRTDNEVKSGGILKKPVLAIVLHRTVGTTIAGAIGHSKGTHFYIEGGKNPEKDGEIFQALSLKNSSNHIFDETARISHFDVKTNNSIGIEVIGMAYKKVGDKYFTNTKEPQEVNPETRKITKGYEDKNGNFNYWDELTEKQIKSAVCLVKLLMKEYSIKPDMILTHEEIQSKTSGEGQAVKDAIFEHLIK